MGVGKPKNVWLIGAGSMALDYFKVLKALEVDVTVIGRGEDSAKRFEAATGSSVATGGLESFLRSFPPPPDAALVSVDVEELTEAAIQLIRHGVRRLLIEKPASTSIEDLRALTQTARDAGAEVFVAYNRRFYAATLHAKRLIQKDGGLLSCHFEFTEWAHVVETQSDPASVKAKWFLANSTHVADLAFHLAGTPAEMSSYTAGSLPWHPSAAVFVGAGVTELGIPFSYQANWVSPGRWGVEALTAKSRLIFRPMEALKITRKGSVLVEDLGIDDRLDRSFKPGVYEQVRRFLGGDDTDLCHIEEHLRRWPYYCRMAAYAS